MTSVVRARWAFLLGIVLGSAALAKGPMRMIDTPRVAPAFDLPSVDGTRQRLADYRGKALVVNFWAVWCAPCRKEMPAMQKAYDTLKDEGLAMIAIHVGPSIDGAGQFSRQLGLTFDIAVDEDMALTDWQVQGLPTTFLVDREGRIVADAVGERDWSSKASIAQLREVLQRQ